MTSSQDEMSGPGLKRGSIGLVDAVVMSCAFVAPAAVLLFGNTAIAGFSGPAIPLVYVVSMAIVLTIAYSIGQLARKMPSAGAFYTYATRTIGPRAGFMTGWLIFVGYAFLIPAQSAIFGGFVHDALGRSGLNVPWWLLSIAITTVVVVLSVLDVGVSLKWGMVGLGFEVLILSILSVIIFIHGGAEGFTLTPFVPDADFGGVNGVALGLVFGAWGFLGFESSATLGEEVSQPRKTLPRAMMLAVVVLGVYYVVVSYAQVIGFGTSAEGIDGLTSDTTAFATLANRYAGGWLATLVDIAAMTSLFALHLATVNATSRIVFAMGRENLVPARLGTVSAKRGTPAAAIYTLAVGSVVVTLLCGLLWGPTASFVNLAFIATLAFIPVYGLMNICCALYYKRNHPTEFSILRHVLVPSLGVLGLLWVLKGNVFPIPAAPFNYFVYGVIAYVLVGLCVAWRLGKTKPEVMAKAGMILGGTEDENVKVYNA